MTNSGLASIRSIPLLVAFTAASAVDLPRNTTRYDFSAVPPAMVAEIASDDPKGLTLMIVKDDQVVFEHAVGNKTLASVFLIASASKMPTSNVVMALVARGLLGLDDRVADHLDFWPQSASDPRSTITIRHCLACTSGLSADDTYEGDGSLTMDQAVQGIATLPLNFTPGTQYGYTGNGFHVAACVAEHVSGMSWAQLVEDAFITPMSLSTFRYPDNTNPRVAGGASSNTDDYARIISAHLARGRYQGTRLFPASMVDRMQEDEFVNQSITTVFSTPAPDATWHYGLSWWIPPYTGAPTEISDPGAFGATPWIDLGRGYAGVIMMQDSGPVGMRVWNALRPHITAAIDAEHDLILVRPAAAVVSGSTVALTARGGAWGPESAIAYTWSVESAPGGAPTPGFSDNGTNDGQESTATLTRAGTWTLKVTIAAPSAPGETITSTVSVTAPATPTSIVIGPDPARVIAGATIDLSADVLDQFAQALSPQPVITWSTTAGSISADGLLTAPGTPGSLEVTASAGALSNTYTVIITDVHGNSPADPPPPSGSSGGGCGMGGSVAALCFAFLLLPFARRRQSSTCDERR